MVIRILGIDPGTARVGFAIVDYTNSSRAINLVSCGVIETSKTLKDASRLLEIRRDLEEIIDKYKPEILAVEKIFFFKNIKTVIPVAQARGVILELGANAGLEIFEYTPLEVKNNITGHGRADKKQVEEMVYQILGLNHKVKPDDAVDAVAIAITCIRMEGHVLINS